uniref:Uncharacterized protein n=2 Tax=Clytia hemisphaerica TaxID=252671 RepID=A0A7M5U6S8_9CNID
MLVIIPIGLIRSLCCPERSPSYSYHGPPTVIGPNGMTTVPAQRTFSMNVKFICGLGITQIVIGLLTAVLAIVAKAVFHHNYSVNENCSGIWFGIWILITGIVGVMSAKKPKQTSINGVNMGFNIVCCVVSFFVGRFFLSGFVHYKDCNLLDVYDNLNDTYDYQLFRDCYDDKKVGAPIFATIMGLMILEFIISMTISITCCRNSGCCCRSNTSGALVMNEHPTPTDLVSPNGVVVSGQCQYPGQQTVYPPQSAAGYPPQSQVIYPAGVYPNHKQCFTTTAHMGGVQNLAYSNQMTHAQLPLYAK